MAKLNWGAAGQRFYETGVDRGVLYPNGGPGVAWNGLISVNESPKGGDSKSYYLDGVKYLNLAEAEEYSATIEAYTYPAEFEVCDGTAMHRKGMLVTQQPRQRFGLSYRTMVGNDIEGTDKGYKIHLVYNALAAPTSRSYGTTTNAMEAMTFTWDLTTTPVFLLGQKPSSHIVLDTATAPSELITQVENLLYGTAISAPRLPTPTELVLLFDNYQVLSDKLEVLEKDAIAFLKILQDPPENRFMFFAQSYTDTYTGPVAGTAMNIPGTITVVPSVGIDAAYDTPDWIGRNVTGTWAGVTPIADYEVQVFSRLDVDYHQGTFELLANGTWTSGATTIRAGEKVVKLVRKADQVVVAEKGGTGSVFDDIEVRLYAYLDIAYLLDTVPLSADGSFKGVIDWAGRKVARVYKVSTGEILASTEWSGLSLPRSFVVEPNDPVYNDAIAARCATYDAALVAMAFLDHGELGRAERILDALVTLQNPEGSWYFSYDAFNYSWSDPYIRTGACAFVVMAAIHHRRVTGSTKYQEMAIKGADYLIAQQAPAGSPVAGLVRQGRGRYTSDYVFIDEQQQGAGTEHNLDAWFVFRDLYHQTGLPRFNDAKNQVFDQMMALLWNPRQNRFNQGVEDPAEALDCDSWGGMMLFAAGETLKAEGALSHMETYRVENAVVAKNLDPQHWNFYYENPGPINGYKPYGVGYNNPPTLVWAEGTWGAILAKQRMGFDATLDLISMLRLSETTGKYGGWIQVTYTQAPWPYEFQTWPCAAAAAWAAMTPVGAPGIFPRTP